MATKTVQDTAFFLLAVRWMNRENPTSTAIASWAAGNVRGKEGREGAKKKRKCERKGGDTGCGEWEGWVSGGLDGFSR